MKSLFPANGPNPVGRSLRDHAERVQAECLRLQHRETRGARFIRADEEIGSGDHRSRSAPDRFDAANIDVSTPGRQTMSFEAGLPDATTGKPRRDASSSATIASGPVVVEQRHEIRGPGISMERRVVRAVRSDRVYRRWKAARVAGRFIAEKADAHVDVTEYGKRT